MLVMLPAVCVCVCGLCLFVYITERLYLLVNAMSTRTTWIQNCTYINLHNCRLCINIIKPHRYYVLFMTYVYLYFWLNSVITIINIENRIIDRRAEYSMNITVLLHASGHHLNHIYLYLRLKYMFMYTMVIHSNQIIIYKFHFEYVFGYSLYILFICTHQSRMKKWRF